MPTPPSSAAPPKRRRHPRLTILHIDAHPDIYHDFQGNPRSHASPFARIMEEGLADRLISVGICTATDHQRRQIERFGVGSSRRSTSGEPGGLSTRQVIHLIHTNDQPLVGADVVEYNPRCDIAGMTATVAARLVREIAGMMVKTAQARTGAG
jgi:arginase